MKHVIRALLAANTQLSGNTPRTLACSAAPYASAAAVDGTTSLRREATVVPIAACPRCERDVDLLHLRMARPSYARGNDP